jgi:hypothetical protein
MNTPQSNTQEKMNWVDYCDSLSEEYFRVLARSQSATATADLFPEPPTISISRLEAERELA